MLLLNKNKIKDLCYNIEDTTWNVMDYTFPDKVIVGFIDCIESYGNEEESLCMKIYIQGISQTVNDSLDLRNRNFDDIMTHTYDKILNANNSIILLPLCLIFRKYYNKKDYFLQVQHKFKTHMMGDCEEVTLEEIISSMYYLKTLNLFPTRLLEEYAESITTTAVSYAAHPMGNCGETNGSLSSIGLKHPSHDISDIVAITDNLKIRDYADGARYASISVDKLRDVFAYDRDTILSVIGDVEICGKKVVQSYLDQNIACIDTIIREEGIDKASRIFDLLRLTKNMYKQYRHLLTTVVMTWLVTLLRNKDVRSSVISGYLIDTSLNKWGISNLMAQKASCTWDFFALVEMTDKISQLIELYRKEVGEKTMEASMIPENIPIAEQTGIVQMNESAKAESNLSDISEYCRIEHTTSQMTRALTESFEVLKDGTIRVVLKSKTSYMDEYATNHRLLKLNAESNDIDGMKYNLVYAMLLVESIEKNVIHNSKFDKTSSEYKDAEKARSFALNDISTYLPMIRKKDKGFDLNKFYTKVKADKCTIEIDVPQTISGVKRIVKSIMV